jgi:hypothetical protein
MSTHAIVLETPIITKQSYASPTSFIGATRRIVPWTLSIARGSPARGYRALMVHTATAINPVGGPVDHLG